MTVAAEGGDSPSHIDLFVYGTLRKTGSASPLLDGCEHRRSARVHGTLYDIEGRFPSLVLEGIDAVEGEIWRCPAAVLTDLDAYEGVAEGLFRRVRVRIGEGVCWVYVAGPALAPSLTPDRRIAAVHWPG